MNIIVFSKDRPMQLELFIRSFNKYVKDFDKYTVRILYTYSNDEYKKGYDKLISNDYYNIIFIKENNFKNDLINLFNPYEKHSVFFVDDIVFKNPIDFYDNQMEIFENDKNIVCRSLRLNSNLTYCYAMGCNISRPNFLENNIFYWNGQQGDYGYPMSVDGHIFRTNEILPYVLYMDYRNPNSFEGNMATRPLNLPKMICYDKSIILNNPCNKVQINNPNNHGNITAEELNNKFLEGYIISLENFDNIENESCHKEMDLIFIKNNKS
jgi:hypothetical protein